MKRHLYLFLQLKTLFHTAQGQLIAQSRFESVLNHVRTISAESLRRRFTQVCENYAVYIFMLFDFFVLWKTLAVSTPWCFVALDTFLFIKPVNFGLTLALKFSRIFSLVCC